jgi:hypothetical protein
MGNVNRVACLHQVYSPWNICGGRGQQEDFGR